MAERDAVTDATASQNPLNTEQDHADVLPPSLTAVKQDFFRSIVTHTWGEPMQVPSTPANYKKRQMATTATTSLRRSRRIASTGAAGPTLQKAQGVLMRKLGILSDQEQITSEAKESYAKLFEYPLSRAQLAALALLFGWDTPPECEVRSAELLN